MLRITFSHVSLSFDQVGGFPQEMFQDMTEEEAEKFTCNICFLIVNECRQCDNRHLFCQTCAFAWTLTYGENSQKCPMCRCDQREYKQNKEVDKVLLDKRVHCQEEGCSFKSPLKIFLMHSHGKLKYSNAHVDLESLRPARHSGARLLVLPRLDFSGVTGANRQARGTMILHQLQQGRVMILQMMTLLDLEIQLREQSFISYQSAMEPMARVQRMDEVLALNEQLNEIGTILSALLTTPMAGQGQRYASPEPSGNVPLGISTGTLTQRLLSGIPPMTTNDDDDDDDSSSTDSSSSDSSLDLSSFRRRESLLHRPNAYPPSSTLSRPPVFSLERTLNEGQAALEQARERREVTQQILSESSGRSNAEQTATASDSILRGREPGMTPRIGQLNRARERQPSVLSPRENDASTSTTSVLRLSSGDVNSTSGPNANRSTAAGSSHASTVGQLPSLAGGVTSHSMQSTTDALSSVSSPPRRDLSRQDTPSPVSREPTPAPIPLGSLALRQAMEAMFRSRTPSNLVSRLSGTRTTTSNSGATEPGQRDTAASAVRPRSAVRGQSSGSEDSKRGESRGSGGNSQAQQEQNGAAGGRTPSASGSSPVQQGSILPASLYRRRQRTDSSLSGRSSNLESGVGTSQTSTLRSSSIARSQNGPLQRSQSIASRRRISAVVPPLNQRDPNATRRPSVPARRTTLSNRLAVDRQTSISSNPSTDSGVSSMTSGRGPRRVTSLAPNRNRVAPTRPAAAAAADGSSNLPKLPGGHARPRRRSEIHQNLLMKK